jgi:enamine deaminase RidA (YjgF/YER057c/UK114 family)
LNRIFEKLESFMVESAKIEKKSIENLDIVIHSAGEIKKYFITANHEKDGKEYSLLDNLMHFLESENAHVLSQLIFGSCKYYNKHIEILEKLSDSFSWPVTWLHGDGCSCDCLTSTQVIAVAGVDVDHIILDGVRVGSCYKDEYAEYCYLGNITTDDLSCSKSDQALAAYNKMERALNSINMKFTDVIRMWNYLDNLLEWYDEFNVMRTAFFNKHDVFRSIVPAGTGIGAGNPLNAAYIGELFAVKPLNNNDDLKMYALPSPMQCPALDYKSSFSRAIEIDLPSSRYISISGTASIEPGGDTVFLDDTAGQIELTMKVISEILKSRNMSWSDTVKAIAYFKDINEKILFDEYLRKNNYPHLPVAIVHADICRDNLLFELELDAVK